MVLKSETVEPGADAGVEGWWPGGAEGQPGADADRPVRIAFCLEEERGALRLFLRAIRRLSLEIDWEAAVWVGDSSDVRLSQRLRDRVRVVRSREVERLLRRVQAGARLAQQRNRVVVGLT